MYRNQESSTRFQIVSGEARTDDEAIQAPAAPASAESRGPAPALPAPADAPGTVGKKPKRPLTRRVGLGAVVVLAVGAAGWFGYDYLTIGRFVVSTDDAYVQAYNTTLAAKVSGYLASVLVTDNTHVHAGDVIATIDDGDYRLAVDFGARKGCDSGSYHCADGSPDRRAGSRRRTS